MSRGEIFERFAHDTRDHVLTILRDDGAYRHLRVGRPGSGCYHYELVTWPGYLAYVGDMGAFTFKRTEDMFAFFREENGSASISPDYWSEKVETKGEGNKKFDADYFRKVVNDYRRKWVKESARDCSLDKAQRRELWEAVDEEVLRFLDDGDEDGARRAANDFCWTFTRRRRPDVCFAFDDLWEHNFERHTDRFLWACHAIVHGISLYDKAKAAKP